MIYVPLPFICSIPNCGGGSEVGDGADLAQSRMGTFLLRKSWRLQIIFHIFKAAADHLRATFPSPGKERSC